MKRQVAIGVFVLISAVTLSGCVVRTYQQVRDRVDQDLTSGNRGYLEGQAPEPAERRATRTTHVLEVELGSPIKFEKAPKKGATQKTSDEEAWGNRGYVSQKYTPEAYEPASSEPSTTEAFKQYTVQRGDTLQKISKKFYGTTKRWKKIYNANTSVLKGPDKIYVGQVINIPVTEGLKEGAGAIEEPVENLK